MGVCLYAKKYDEYDKTPHMGYLGFYQLRLLVAKKYNDELGQHYGALLQQRNCIEWEEYNKRTDEFVKKNNLDERIIDFLYQSDCNGKVDYITCKRIYELIKDEDFIVHKGIAEKLKTLLQECIKHRWTLQWC